MMIREFWKNLISKLLIDKSHKWIDYLSSEEKILLRKRLSEIHSLDCADHKIHLHVDSLLELQNRIYSCSKEPRTVHWLERELRPTDTYYDIGANVGTYSLYAAKVAEGKVNVYAFEPSFQNFNQLCRNIILNHCQSIITPLMIPLCRETQFDKFYYQNMEIGGALHSFACSIDYKAEKYDPVASLYAIGFSLDSVVEIPGFRLPNLIKLDVDGLEYDILLGAEKVLMHSGLRSILLEINEDLIGEATNIVEHLYSKGFIPEEKYRLSQNLYNYIFKRNTDELPLINITDVHLSGCREKKK